MSKSIANPTPAGIAMSVIGSPIVSTIGDVITTCSKEKTKRIEMSPDHLNAKAAAESTVIRTKGETEAMVLSSKHYSETMKKERMVELELITEGERAYMDLAKEDRKSISDMYKDLIKTCDEKDKPKYIREFSKLTREIRMEAYAHHKTTLEIMEKRREAEVAAAVRAEALERIAVAKAEETTRRLEAEAEEKRKDSMGFFDHMFVYMVKPYKDIIELQTSAITGRPIVFDQYGKPKLKSVK